MSVWEPEEGEYLLTRTDVCLARGEHPSVSGKHWFRDTRRRDISARLPGWPAAPVHTRRTKGEVRARRGLGGAVAVLGALILGLFNYHDVELRDPDASGTSEDPANEIEDFPVIWGDPGSLATTLPWQLDTDRSDQNTYLTHLVVTDRRLVVLGVPQYGDTLRVEDEILWELPRSQVARTELCDYLTTTDFRIVFTDGSWCRLRDTSRAGAVRYLAHAYETVALASLAPALRTAVEVYAAEEVNALYYETTPYVTRRSCGHYLAEFPAFAPHCDGGLSTRRFVCSADGTPVPARERHPEDF